MIHFGKGIPRVFRGNGAAVSMMEQAMVCRVAEIALRSLRKRVGHGILAWSALTYS